MSSHEIKLVAGRRIGFGVFCSIGVPFVMVSLPGRLLHFLGANGPLLIVVAVVAGTLLGPATPLPHWGVPLAALLLTLGSFLCAALSPADRPATGVGATLLAMLWVGLVMPVGVLYGLSQADVSPELMSGLALAVVAPPTGSAVAIATMLGLRPRLALLVTVGLTLLAPLTMPLYLRHLGIAAHFDLMALEYALAMIVGASALVAAIVVRKRHTARWLLPDPPAAAGIAVIGLMIIGWIAGAKCIAAWRADPAGFSMLLAAALALNVGSAIVGILMFLAWGARAAMTVGLCNGSRNVTLVWAIAGGSLSAQGEHFIAAAVLPILLLPLTAKAVLWLKAFIETPLHRAQRRPDRRRSPPTEVVAALAGAEFDRGRTRRGGTGR